MPRKSLSVPKCARVRAGGSEVLACFSVWPSLVFVLIWVLSAVSLLRSGALPELFSSVGGCSFIVFVFVFFEAGTG